MRLPPLLAEPLRRIATKLALMATRGVVRGITDSAGVQELRLRGLAGETLRAERFQEYGFTSRPLVGAEAILLSLGGNREHTVVIAVDDRRFRLKNLATGDVALYTDEGDMIWLRSGNRIEVHTGKFTVFAGSSKMELSDAGFRVEAPAVDFEST